MAKENAKSSVEIYNKIIAEKFVYEKSLIIQELNRNFRGKDTPTNVLSFPFEVPDFLRHEVSTLGDIIIAMPIIEIEAMRQRKSVDDHLTHLIIHCTVHLLGFDHLEEAEADEMEALEIKMLQTLGIQNPYLV